MKKYAPCEISAVNLGDFSDLARIQILADRKMDVLLEHELRYEEDIAGDDLKLRESCLRSYFAMRAMGDFPDPHFQGLKAVFDGVTVGCFFTGTDTMQPDSCIPSVESLFVHPVYWGRGIASQLINRGILGLREKGVTHCCLWADNSNEILNDFYTHLGWKRNPKRVIPMEINGRTSTAVLFERNI